jgi:uncharacterized protein (DUF885 family)
MKIRILLSYLTVLLMLNTVSAYAATTVSADPGDNAKTIKERVSKMTPDQKEARALEIRQQIQDIKNMDKSQLSPEQRKALRHELKDMKKELKQMGPTYIYISGAGLVLIIILLIILL